MMEIMDWIGYGVMLGVLLFIEVGLFLTFRSERKIWNGGICKETKKPWEPVMGDSQGGCYYTSEGIESGWLSWHTSPRLAVFFLWLVFLVLLVLALAPFVSDIISFISDARFSTT